MKRTSALIAAALLAISSTQAAIVLQSQNFSNVNETTPASLTWNKFDLSLGTLTAITFEATGVFSGSYTITTLSTNFPTQLTSNTTGQISLTLLGPGSPGYFIGSLIDPLITFPASTAGQTIGPSSSTTFTLSSGVGINQSTFSSNEFANAAYYSALGGGTFGSSVELFIGMGLIGDDYTGDVSTLLAGGTVNLTYVYTPNTAVPEPGTWAAAALLVGAAGYVRWRRRKTS